MNTEELVANVFYNGTDAGSEKLSAFLELTETFPKNLRVGQECTAGILTRDSDHLSGLDALCEILRDSTEKDKFLTWLLRTHTPSLLLDSILLSTTVTVGGIRSFIALPEEWITAFNKDQFQTILSTGQCSTVNAIETWRKRFQPLAERLPWEDIHALIVAGSATNHGLEKFNALPQAFHTWLLSETQKQPRTFKLPVALLCPKWDKDYALIQQLFTSQPKNLTLQMAAELCSGKLSQSTLETLKQAMDYRGEKELWMQIVDYLRKVKWSRNERNDFASLFKTIQGIFKEVAPAKIELILLRYLEDSIDNPHAGMLFMSRKVLEKFTPLYWEKNEHGRLVYDPRNTKQQQGEPILLALLTQIANSNHVDPTLGDKYACFKFILENYDPKYQPAFIEGDPSSTIPIPINAFGSFNTLLQAVRSIRLNLDPKTKALFAELKKVGGKPWHFFSTLLCNESVNKNALILAVKAFLNNDRAFFEAKSSHTPDPIDSMLKVSNYLDVGREGTAAIQLTPRDLWECCINGWLDGLKFVGALEIEKQVLTKLNPQQKEQLEILLKTVDKLNVTQMVAWASGKNPKTLLSSDPKGPFANLQQKQFEKLQIQLLECFADLDALKTFLQTMQARLQKADIALDFKAGSETFLQPIIHKLSLSFNWVQGKINGPNLAMLVAKDENQEALRELLNELQRELRAGVIHTMAALTGSQVQTIGLRIVPPSDPLSHAKGDATASCDGLGDGKCTAYNVLPGCASLVLTYTLPGSGNEAVFTQSTVTLNKVGFGKEMQRLISSLKEKKIPKEPLHTCFENTFLERWMEAPWAICMDNVEGNKGLVARFLKYDDRFITDLYREIGEKISAIWGGARVVVGNANSDYVKGLPKVLGANIPMPVQFLIYTDATENVGALLLQKEGHSAFIENQQKQLASKVVPLTAEWTLPVMYIQEEAYRGAAGLVEPAHQVQNNIMAALLANQVYGQRNFEEAFNLSSIAFDKDGIPAGYLIAYPAKSEYSKSGVLEKGAKVIYVHDIAVREKYIGSGRIAGRLLPDFLAKWIKLGNIPILADVRESTSYPMLKRAATTGHITLIELKKEGELIKVLIRQGKVGVTQPPSVS